MKKSLLLLILIVTTFLTGCSGQRQIIILNTDVNDVMQLLDDCIKMQNFQYSYKDENRKLYSINTENSTGFSCKFRQVDKKNVLADCTSYGYDKDDYSFNERYIYVHEYFNFLKREDLKYINYKKYKKLKENGKLIKLINTNK